jgi:large conductance mechanosensitive channel
MPLLQDFKQFAFKGNVIDLAVGVVIGGAFGKIVSGMVDNVVMPIVSLGLPHGDWRNASIVLRTMPDAKDNVVLKYGALVGSVIDFLIIAFVLFLVVSRILRVQAAKAADPGPKPEEKMVSLLTEIRDGLKTR